MKCINPIVGNFITRVDLSGRKYCKKSFFNLRSYLGALRSHFSSSGSFLKSFRYRTYFDYSNDSYNIFQEHFALSSKGDVITHNYKRYFDFNTPVVSMPDDEDDVSYDLKSFVLRCRKCPSCLLSSIREKTLRCMKEFVYSGSLGCMLTLTYKDEYLPYKEGSDSGKPVVRYRDVQLFLKRLRRRLFGSSKGYLKYFACCEYSPKNNRPHIHIFLIGYDFGLSEMKKYPERTHGIVRSGTSDKGKCPYYMSKFLNELWPFGRAVISEANSSTAYYVAGYTMKKIIRPVVVVDGVPEVHHFSKGLGLNWFLMNYKEILSKGYIVTIRDFGSFYPVAIPKYFLGYARKLDPELFQTFLERRQFRETVSFDLCEFLALDNMRINLEKKFAFIDR